MDNFASEVHERAFNSFDNQIALPGKLFVCSMWVIICFKAFNIKLNYELIQNAISVI